jgi:hypothetical protein
MASLDDIVLILILLAVITLSQIDWIEAIDL